jgi:2-methylaconitate cis-trans-isomerase PrpF
VTSLGRLPAVFMRGGTSKAIVLERKHLPAEPSEWDAIFLSIMGSPDPNGRQLDGMGGGLSSLSKIAVVGPSSRTDADVDYTFAQIAIGEAKVDYSGNCGNISSAIGPFALEAGLVPCPANGPARVRIHNTNTGKIIIAEFPTDAGKLAQTGSCQIDGVTGTAAPIRLEFLEPGGAKTGQLLPTGRVCNRVEIAGCGSFTLSCVDAANPCVFVDAEALGKRGIETPEQLEKDRDFCQLMQRIRATGAVLMGLAHDLDSAAALGSIPQVAMVAPPQQMTTLGGQLIAAESMDLCIRAVSMAQQHRAVPITGAICTAVAAAIPGSVVNELARPDRQGLRVAHPSGIVEVDAQISGSATNGWSVDFGAVYRTARRLFEGQVFYRC